MRKKYYIYCPNCEVKVRMRRTGKKTATGYHATYYETIIDLYIREYECPRCGWHWCYDEYRNFLTPGKLR